MLFINNKRKTISAGDLLDAQNEFRASASMPRRLAAASPAVLAEALVLRDVKAEPISIFYRTYCWWDSTPHFARGSQHRDFLERICEQIGITAVEIENAGFTWEARIAPVDGEQKKGLVPAPKFIHAATQSLLSQKAITDSLEDASKSFRKYSWMRTVALTSAGAATLSMFISNVVSPVIMLPSVGVLACGLIADLCVHGMNIDLLVKLQKQTQGPIINQWTAAARETGLKKISLRDVYYGYEAVKDFIQPHMNPFIVSMIKRGTKGLVRQFEEMDAEFFCIEDIAQVPVVKNQQLIDNAISSRLAYARGFAIEIESANAALQGTRLQILAKYEGGQPPDRDDSNKRKRKDPKKILDWLGAPVPVG